MDATKQYASDYFRDTRATETYFLIARARGRRVFPSTEGKATSGVAALLMHSEAAL
jgi:hypothetical protein